MFKLFRYLGKREWAMAGCALLFILGQVWLDLRLPEYMSEITVLVQTEGSAMGDILHAGGLMLLCALGSMVLAIATGFLTAVGGGGTAGQEERPGQGKGCNSFHIHLSFLFVIRRIRPSSGQTFVPAGPRFPPPPWR